MGEVCEREAEWYHQNAKGNREKKRAQISIMSRRKGKGEEEKKKASPRIPLQDNTFHSPRLWWFCWRRWCRDTTVDALLARPQQPDQVREELLHILGCLGRCFQEPAAKIAGHSGAFFSGYFALVLLVAFIADEHEYRPMPLHLEHSLAEDLEALECCPRGNRVDEDEPLTLSVIR